MNVAQDGSVLGCTFLQMITLIRYSRYNVQHHDVVIRAGDGRMV